MTTITILLNNALSHIQIGEFDKADELLVKAEALDASNPDILRLLSVVAAMKFDYVRALELINRSISLAPDNALAHSNRGNILKELHRLEEALISLEAAIELAPEYAEAYNNKSNVLQDLHRYEEALQWYDKAISLMPDYAEAYSNKGNALELLHRHQEAMECFDIATAINPQYVDAYWHKALGQLSGGNYETGWQNYEARWFKSHASKLLYSNIPRLEALQNIAGKQILIWAEQGLGDTLQFCRYIKPLVDLDASVTFVVQKPLMKVLGSLRSCCTLVDSIDSELKHFDYQSPLLSLPLLFETNVETIPAGIPYLACDQDKKAQFESRVAKGRNLRVGVVWNGGFRVDHPELWAINKRRNIELEQITKLKDVPGVDFYSLQKGDPAESELITKKDELWPNIINCAQWLDDFSDTAALIENLDLIISVDTSTAHLAGALGKPVWILNRYDSCWRWLRGRSDSPWYPTAKIYQQPKPGDWDSVLEQVKIDLSALALQHLNQ
nr:tetratricopeptide repeat-containing glycosyltransferase family protein [Polynucleobacter sp. 71A-WALBACH]